MSYLTEISLQTRLGKALLPQDLSVIISITEVCSQRQLEFVTCESRDLLPYLLQRLIISFHQIECIVHYPKLREGICSSFLFCLSLAVEDLHGSVIVSAALWVTGSISLARLLSCRGSLHILTSLKVS